MSAYSVYFIFSDSKAYNVTGNSDVNQRNRDTMSDGTRTPGVSRGERAEDEGLRRLDRQLTGGAAPNAEVLSQWVRRYGDAAREIIRRHGLYSEELDQP